MKLCIVTHRVVKGDGQGRVNYEIVWEAIRRQHHVTLVASEVEPELRQSDWVNWIDIAVKSVPTAFLRNLVFSWQSGNWLRQHRGELDSIVVNGAITQAASDINIVHFVHSSWLRSPAHTWQQRRDAYGLYQWMYTATNAYWEKQAFRQANAIVAVSQKVARELIDIGVPSDRVRSIFNGVDLQEFCPSPVDRSQLGLSEDVTLALFVGDIRTPRKNLESVLHSLVAVPNLHLAVVGTTEGSPYLQLADQLGLNERVHFLGYRRDVPQIVRAADLFVFPSRYEACTLVLLEAMATGLPVITAIATGGSEIVTPECGVVLPDSEDVLALARVLARLAGDRQLRSRMGQAARAIAEQHSWTGMAEKYLDLFEDLYASQQAGFILPLNQTATQI